MEAASHAVLARDNLIMFLYYLVSSCLQFALIGLGVMYVMQKGRQKRGKENKDEQLRDKKRRRDEDLRFKHEHSNQRMPEWRKFSKAVNICLLYTSPSPRDLSTSRMPSSA